MAENPFAQFAAKSSAPAANPFEQFAPASPANGIPSPRRGYSLTELARLSRLAAEKSAESWNTRVKQIPAAALEGTGITAEPVVVPPRKTSSVMNIPTGAINALKAGQGTPEQFDAVFGAGSAAQVLGKGK